MKKLMMVGVLILAAASALAAIKITEPASGSTVGQLYPVQAKFVRMSLEERDIYFDGAANAKALTKDGSQPKPIKIAWTGSSGACKVELRRLPDGKVFFEGESANGTVNVDSLEIAREWEITVSGGGETAKSTFKTEDQAPRLIYMNKKIVNARDLGGRIGIDGRRIRQGMLFRMVGLNENATFDKKLGKKVSKLYAEGKLEVKGPGETRMTEEERVAIMKRWGFKSDLDLRSNLECHGMTGSPLGSEVKWLHYPYGAYRIDEDYAKKRNGIIFRLFLDAENYPMVFHCIGGADRTGTLACLLEAVLGVDENNLWMDYLTTGFRGTVNDPKHKKSFGRIFEGLKKCPGNNWCERAENYFKACGFTDADIAKLREMLLEPADGKAKAKAKEPAKAKEKAKEETKAKAKEAKESSEDGPGYVKVVWSADKGESWEIKGLAERETGRPMKKDTVFAIASNTKPVASVLALTLVEEGKIDLDDPVSKYLPEFANIKLNGQPPKRPVLLRYLLTHLSGLQYAVRDPGRKINEIPYREQAAWAVKRGLRAQPGEAYQYCGLGFSVMGAIIEQVTGRKVPDLMKERIFDPLGMTETTFYPDDAMLARTAIPYYYPPKGGAPQRYDFSNRWTLPLGDTTHTPGLAGGLFSTVGDYLKFSQMIALKGVGANGKRILSEETFEKYLLTRQTPPGDPKDASFDIQFTKDHHGGNKGGLYGTNAQWDWVDKTCTITFRAKSPYPPKDAANAKDAKIDASGFDGQQTRFKVGKARTKNGKVGCMVSNNEDRHGVGTVWLMVNGEKKDEKKVELAIGESKRVIFKYEVKEGDKFEVVMANEAKSAAPKSEAAPVKIEATSETVDREVKLRDGIGRFLAKVEVGKPVKVAYLGGSITENDGYRNLTTEYLQQKYPKAKITEIPAGIGGSGSDLGVYRLEHDVLVHDPDLVFVEFAMNDYSTSAERIIRQMEGIVRQIWRKNPETDIVFLYTVAAVDKGKGHRTPVDVYAAGEIPPSVLADEQVAERYGIPSVNFAYRVVDEFKAGRLVMTLKESFTWVPKETPKRDQVLAEKLAKEGKVLFSKDGAHPVMAGSQIYFASMMNFLEKEINGRGRPLSQVGKDHAKRLEGATISADPLVAAKMVPVTKDMMIGEWEKSEKNKVAKFVERLDEIWETKTPGSKLKFSFNGSQCRIYDMQGPDGGQVWITVDGKRKPKPQPRFDAHCTYHRRSSFTVYDGEKGVHTVEIELDSQQPDRRAVLGRLSGKDAEKELASPKYNGTRFWPAKILVDGEIFSHISP